MSEREVTKHYPWVAGKPGPHYVIVDTDNGYASGAGSSSASLTRERRLWIDAKGRPVITTTANGARNATRWGWMPATAIPVSIGSCDAAWAATQSAPDHLRPADAEAAARRRWDAWLTAHDEAVRQEERRGAGEHTHSCEELHREECTMTGTFIEVGTDRWVNVSKITAIVPQKSGPKYNGHHEAMILMDGGTEIPAGRGVIASDVIGKLVRVPLRASGPMVERNERLRASDAGER